MIRNKDELKEKIKKELDKKAEEFVDNLADTSETEEFTIDTIEEIMTRFNSESKQIIIETVNEAISSFDEKEIINKKNKKLKDWLTKGKEARI